MSISNYQIQIGGEYLYLDLSGFESIYRWMDLQDPEDEYPEISSTYELWLGLDSSLLLTSTHYSNEPELTRQIGRLLLPEEAVSLLTDQDGLHRIQRKHVELLERQVGNPLVYRVTQPTKLEPSENELDIYCNVLEVRTKNSLASLKSLKRNGFLKYYRQFLDAFEIVVIQRQLLNRIFVHHDVAREALLELLPYLHEGLKIRLKEVVFDGYPELVGCVERKFLVRTLQLKEEELYSVGDDILLMDKISWPRINESVTVVNDVVRLLRLDNPSPVIELELKRFGGDYFTRSLGTTVKMPLPMPETAGKVERESKQFELHSEASMDKAAAAVTPDISGSTANSPEAPSSSKLDLPKSETDTVKRESDNGTVPMEELLNGATISEKKGTPRNSPPQVDSPSLEATREMPSFENDTPVACEAEATSATAVFPNAGLLATGGQKLIAENATPVTSTDPTATGNRPNAHPSANCEPDLAPKVSEKSVGINSYKNFVPTQQGNSDLGESNEDQKRYSQNELSRGEIEAKALDMVVSLLAKHGKGPLLHLGSKLSAEERINALMEERFQEDPSKYGARTLLEWANELHASTKTIMKTRAWKGIMAWRESNKVDRKME